MAAGQDNARTRLTGQIDIALRTQGAPGRAEHERAYLKSGLEHYDTTVPAIRSVARAVASQHPGLSRDDLLRLPDAPWAVPVHERPMAAVELLGIYHERLCGQDVVFLSGYPKSICRSVRGLVAVGRSQPNWRFRASKG